MMLKYWFQGSIRSGKIIANLTRNQWSMKQQTTATSYLLKASFSTSPQTTPLPTNSVKPGTSFNHNLFNLPRLPPAPELNLEYYKYNSTPDLTYSFEEIKTILESNDQEAIQKLMNSLIELRQFQSNIHLFNYLATSPTTHLNFPEDSVLHLLLAQKINCNYDHLIEWLPIAYDQLSFRFDEQKLFILFNLSINKCKTLDLFFYLLSELQFTNLPITTELFDLILNQLLDKHIDIFPANSNSVGDYVSFLLQKCPEEHHWSYCFDRLLSVYSYDKILSLYATSLLPQTPSNVKELLHKPMFLSYFMIAANALHNTKCLQLIICTNYLASLSSTSSSTSTISSSSASTSSDKTLASLLLVQKTINFDLITELSAIQKDHLFYTAKEKQWFDQLSSYLMTLSNPHPNIFGAIASWKLSHNLITDLKHNTNEVLLTHLNEENAMEMLGSYLAIACHNVSITTPSFEEECKRNAQFLYDVFLSPTTASLLDQQPASSSPSTPSSTPSMYPTLTANIQSKILHLLSTNDPLFESILNQFLYSNDENLFRLYYLFNYQKRLKFYAIQLDKIFTELSRQEKNTLIINLYENFYSPKSNVLPRDRKMIPAFYRPVLTAYFNTNASMETIVNFFKNLEYMNFVFPMQFLIDTTEHFKMNNNFKDVRLLLQYAKTYCDRISRFPYVLDLSIRDFIVLHNLLYKKGISILFLDTQTDVSLINEFYLDYYQQLQPKHFHKNLDYANRLIHNCIRECYKAPELLSRLINLFELWKTESNVPFLKETKSIYPILSLLFVLNRKDLIRPILELYAASASDFTTSTIVLGDLTYTLHNYFEIKALTITMTNELTEYVEYIQKIKQEIILKAMETQNNEMKPLASSSSLENTSDNEVQPTTPLPPHKENI